MLPLSVLFCSFCCFLPRRPRTEAVAQRPGADVTEKKQNTDRTRKRPKTALGDDRNRNRENFQPGGTLSATQSKRQKTQNIHRVIKGTRCRYKLPSFATTKTIDAVAVSHENKQRSCETRKQGSALVSTRRASRRQQTKKNASSRQRPCLDPLSEKPYGRRKGVREAPPHQKRLRKREIFNS